MLNSVKQTINPYFITKNDNKLKMLDIEKQLNLFSNKINECINETNVNISNICKQISNDKKEIEIIKAHNSEKEDSYTNNVFNQIIKILENILEKSKDKGINDVIGEKNDNIKKIYEEKNNLIKSEINKSINEYNDILISEINKINEEIMNIKEFIKNIKTLINNKTNEVENNIKTQTNEHKNNIIEEIIFNAFNQPKTYLRSRSKPIRTLQPHKFDIKNKNLKVRRNSSQRIKSLGKKFNSTEENLPEINEIKGHIKNKTRSYSSSSLYFEDNEKNNITEDNDLSEKILKIETKIESIYSNIKEIPEQVEEKISKDVLNYFDKLKELMDNYLAEKIRNKFKLKYCKDCEKVESFYCFKKCFNCNNDFCLNNIILCHNCKQFICKECYQKGHKCN